MPRPQTTVSARIAAMVLAWWLFSRCYPKSISGAKVFNKSDLIEVQSPVGPFFLNLNQTGEQDDLTRVEVFSYARNLNALAEMVTSEQGNSKVRRTTTST